MSLFPFPSVPNGYAVHRGASPLADPFRALKCMHPNFLSVSPEKTPVCGSKGGPRFLLPAIASCRNTWVGAR